MTLVRFACAVALVSCVVSCNRDDEETTGAEPERDSGADASASPVEAGTDAGAGLDAGAADSGPDAAVLPLPSFGLNAFAEVALPDAGVPDPSADLLLELDLLALRVEATQVVLPWNTEDVDDVIDKVARLANAGVEVSLELELFAGERALRPAGAVGFRVTDVLPLVDELFERNVAARYLILGNALDVHYASLSAEEQVAFADFISRLLPMLTGHPSRPKHLAIGYNSTLASQLAPSPALKDWSERSEVIGIDWFALDDELMAVDPASVAETMQRLVKVQAHARPIVLQQVAYPSAAIAGGSTGDQAGFYTQLFDAVSLLGHRIQFVSVSSLDEPDRAACVTRAGDFGFPSDQRFTEAWCSIGLRARDLTPKPAYHAVLEGLGRFAAH